MPLIKNAKASAEIAIAAATTLKPTTATAATTPPLRLLLQPATATVEQQQIRHTLRMLNLHAFFFKVAPARGGVWLLINSLPATCVPQRQRQRQRQQQQPEQRSFGCCSFIWLKSCVRSSRNKTSSKIVAYFRARLLMSCKCTNF